MMTGNFTKLMFAGLASGIALSCAVVLATSISTVPVSKPDVTTPSEKADARSDRVVHPRTTDQVVRSEKSDALEIAISILNGDEIVPDDPASTFNSQETASVTPADETGPEVVDTEVPVETTAAIDPAAATPDATEANFEDTGEQDQTREQDVAREEASPEPVPAPAPAPRQVTVRTTPAGPINIIPTPEPVENVPAAAPTTTQNFTTEAPASPDNSIDVSR